jgi:hypothetical protein
MPASGARHLLPKVQHGRCSPAAWNKKEVETKPRKAGQVLAAISLSIYSPFSCGWGGWAMVVGVTQLMESCNKQGIVQHAEVGEAH